MPSEEDQGKNLTLLRTFLAKNGLIQLGQCNGVRPVCSPCAKRYGSEAQCSWGVNTGRGGGISRDYIMRLEDRVRELERGNTEQESDQSSPNPVQCPLQLPLVPPPGRNSRGHLYLPAVPDMLINFSRMPEARSQTLVKAPTNRWGFLPRVPVFRERLTTAQTMLNPSGIQPCHLRTKPQPIRVPAANSAP